MPSRTTATIDAMDPLDSNSSPTTDGPGMIFDKVITEGFNKGRCFRSTVTDDGVVIWTFDNPITNSEGQVFEGDYRVHDRDVAYWMINH